jgi:uncharacterized protein YjbI with pentapeptide repeats
MSEKTKDKQIKDLQKQNQLLQKKLEKIDTIQKRNWNIKVWIARRFAGIRLNRSINKLFKELPNNVTKETLGDVTASIIWRITRIGIFAILAALIPYILLYNQNKLFKAQNKLFENQNDRIEQQTNLIESQRRSNYVLLMSNILDKVDEELKDAEDIPYHESRKLSELTIGRIAALSQSLRPYYYLDGDTLIGMPLSPERGQLLLALINSRLDTLNTLPKIFQKSIFYQSDLKNVKLDSSYLRGLNLYLSDLREANLNKANLRRSILTEVNLEGANLAFANLDGATLVRANLEDAYMAGSSLTVDSLPNSFPTLKVANLTAAKMRGADLMDSNLRWARLNSVDMRGANLRGAELQGASLLNVNLNNVIVSGLDWVDKHKEFEIRGFEEIENRYYIDTVTVHSSIDDFIQYIIKENLNK